MQGPPEAYKIYMVPIYSPRAALLCHRRPSSDDILFDRVDQSLDRFPLDNNDSQHSKKNNILNIKKVI